MLSYWLSGSGHTKIILFHGFGQSHEVFSSWIGALGKSHTIYSFDLFFHGQSHWHSREPLEKADWREIMSMFFQQESISEFEVVGFSMGGKFALATLELFPTKVKKLTLLAPDGVKTSFWYSLATYPVATRALFKGMILHPRRLHTLAHVLRALRLVDNGMLRFAEHQMNTEEKRRQVYFTWVYFRHLKFRKSQLIQLINTHSIECHLIAGRHDRVITAKNMESFALRVRNGRFHVIEAGHNDLIAKSLPYIGNNYF